MLSYPIASLKQWPIPTFVLELPKPESDLINPRFKNIKAKCIVWRMWTDKFLLTIYVQMITSMVILLFICTSLDNKYQFIITHFMTLIRYAKFYNIYW